MLKDITLGQYFPGSSIVHRLDPRAKLAITVIYIVALFVAKWAVSYAVMIAFLAMVTAIAHIKPKALFKGLKPILIIVIFTAIINLFYSKGEPLVQIWRLTITKEGLWNAVLMALRIMMLICGSFLLTYTTSPIMLTDALESVLRPLNYIKVPVHELALMMGIALRFIPTLIEETDKIMSAQKARGADFSTGNLLQRAKALIPILVPLFVSAFRRADDLAVAMEARCYHNGKDRTRLHVLKMHARDYMALLVAIVILAAVVVLRIYGL